MGIRNLVDKKYPWFIKVVNDYLASGAMSHPSVGHFRPSAFSMCKDIDDMCVRSMFYDYIGVSLPFTFPLEVIKRMRAGTAHHDMWETIFREAGIKVNSANKLRMKGNSIYVLNEETGRYRKTRSDNEADYPDIRGTHDWDILEKPEGEPELIEWKSGGYRAPKFGHIIQWNIYSVMLNIKKGWVVLESRDSADPEPYYLERDDKILTAIFNKLRYIENCAEKKIVPHKDERCVAGGKWKPEDCAQCSLCSSDKGDNPWL